MLAAFLDHVYVAEKSTQQIILLLLHYSLVITSKPISIHNGTRKCEILRS